MRVLAFMLALMTIGSVGSAQGADTVDITIEVSIAGLPYATCPVTLDAAQNGGDALDAAVATGCLASWESDAFGDFGRYVKAIDDIEADNVSGQYLTYWSLELNDAWATTGIDAMTFQDGDELGLEYTTWLLALV